MYSCNAYIHSCLLQVYIMKYKLIYIALFAFFACNAPEKDVVLRDFDKPTMLHVMDSIIIEDIGILNPHYMQY